MSLSLFRVNDVDSTIEHFEDVMDLNVRHQELTETGECVAP